MNRGAKAVTVFLSAVGMLVGIGLEYGADVAAGLFLAVWGAVFFVIVCAFIYDAAERP